MDDVRAFVFINRSGDAGGAYLQAEAKNVVLTDDSVIRCNEYSVEHAINIEVSCKVARHDTLIVGSIMDLAEGDDLDGLEDTLRFLAGREVLISSYRDGTYPASVFVDMLRFGKKLLVRFSPEEE